MLSYTNTIVMCEMKKIPRSCSPVIEGFFDAIILASTEKDRES